MYKFVSETMNLICSLKDVGIARNNGFYRNNLGILVAANEMLNRPQKYRFQSFASNHTVVLL